MDIFNEYDNIIECCDKFWCLIKGMCFCMFGIQYVNGQFYL